MIFFPPSTIQQLEFDKVKELLSSHCLTVYAKAKSLNLRIHTKKEYIERDLRQSLDYKLILDNGLHFPNDYVKNIDRELKLLNIPGATLSGDEFSEIRKLAESASAIFR